MCNEWRGGVACKGCYVQGLKALSESESKSCPQALNLDAQTSHWWGLSGQKEGPFQGCQGLIDFTLTGATLRGQTEYDKIGTSEVPGSRQS